MVISNASLVLAVTAVAGSVTLGADRRYRVSCQVDAWINLTGTAAKSADSHFIGAGSFVVVDTSNGRTSLSAITDGASATGTLCASEMR